MPKHMGRVHRRESLAAYLMLLPDVLGLIVFCCSADPVCHLCQSKQLERLGSNEIYWTGKLYYPVF